MFRTCSKGQRAKRIVVPLLVLVDILATFIRNYKVNNIANSVKAKSYRYAKTELTVELNY